MRVLLVEDDESIAEPLAEGLSRYGIVTTRVGTGADALKAPLGDFVLLDLGLPDIDGIDVCRRLRQVSDVSIIMLTARGDLTDRVLGLEIGADDYMAKPFSTRELVARMRAIGRRATTRASSLESLTIDDRARQASVDGETLPLTPKEYQLLALLAAQPGTVVDRRRILGTVWEPNFFGRGKTLDFHVATLRRKLGDPRWIENRRGIGFRLVLPSQWSQI
ncbi:response regulator transcription factor [Actinoplanes couchii]|uniref:DNA-binding response regulator n=1 Tax=Actinoplanes couchii TaxID=403638 RepID=A0ABQ3XLC7_9ACTN|nr:response regulator transcription factor [Actinoplanes couchii]MDR6318331.1 DNA-binding response OmpR family regulator [Actinoplanes couchii]GID59299.1 DNA-binding response regulator [Actinoplanes couchii]